MASKPQSTTCGTCEMDPRFTHTAREHGVAEAWLPELLTYIKTDAFVRTDSTLSYAEAIDYFHLDCQVRRAGRVLDAAERILLSSGWPERAAAGVSAYVVNASTRRPGSGWMELWQRDPMLAREDTRAYIRELALAND